MYKKPWKAWPFPIKLMNIFWLLDILQKRRKLNVFHWKCQENTLFHFDCNPEGNASIKKAQRKNLVQAIYKKNATKFPPLSLSFGYDVDTN